MRGRVTPQPHDDRGLDCGDRLRRGGRAQAALQRIQPVGPTETDSAIAAAMRALKDADDEIRMEAAVSLGRLAIPQPGSSDRPDVDRARAVARTLLEAFLHDQDANVRASTATGLASIYGNIVKAGIRPADFPENDPLRAETLVAAFDVPLRDGPANRVPLVSAIERLGTVRMAAPEGVLSALEDPTHVVRGQALLCSRISPAASIEQSRSCSATS